MEAFALYLFKSVVWLTGFALVYLLFLRNERYFLLNRIYLIAGMVASILFPFFTWHYTIVIPFTPAVEVSDLQMTGVISEPEAFPTKTILLYAYMAGCIYLLYRIIRQTSIVIRVIRKSEILPYRSARLIRTAKYPASFSFFSFVFVNPSSSETETNEIVNHELEHVRQRHWIDLVLFELLCTLQWLNPLCWLYGRFIRQNHEFLADQHALQRTANPAIYRAALINQLFGGEVISLANSFNYSINNKRFQMMKNTINPPIRKLKLLVVIPLMAAVFYAFATPEYKYMQADSNTTQQSEKTITGKVIDEKGNPLDGAIVVISGTTIGTATDVNGTFKLIITDASPIVVTHVGFESQKLSPDTEKEMIITLKPVNIGIDEVTVTGAYRDNPGQATLGSAINVQTNPSLEFRKADGSAAKPLIVIDGAITENTTLKNIPPETIESINILKDGSATAVYGDKGKNGVILINTKKGSSTSQNILIDLNKKDADAQKNSEVYTMVEQMPEYPGGQTALLKFIAYSIKYPTTAVDNGIQGKVFVTFVVDKTGKVSDARIVRGVYPALDQEALRVVMLMPQWKPGKQGGKDVSVEYTIPINFVLEKQIQTEAEKQKNTIEIKEEPYTVVEQMPEFRGGHSALLKFVAENVKYPAAAYQKGIQGKVFVSFVVTKTGSVTNAKVVRGVDPLLDNEAIRVVESMPLWIPGKQNGETVVVSYTLPVNFVLQESKTEAEKQKNTIEIKEEPYTVVEQMPEFPGGNAALSKYIVENVKYPAEASKKGIQGKVFISFVVTSAGKVTDAKVARGVDPLLDQEAIRVVESLPTWIPGMQGGKNVATQYTMPINFVLEKAKPQADPSAQKGKLIIVPNPTQSQATVTLEGSNYAGKLEVSLFDSYGKLLLKESKNGPSFTISVNSLTPGTYLVVTYDGSKQYQGNLVVNH